MFYRAVFFISLVASLVFTGCKEKSKIASGNSGEAQSAPRKILHFGNGAEPQFLDPQVATGVPEYAIARALFEGLVNRSADAVSVIPGVAEKWEISADKKVYTFHLRTDARWSDGTGITTADFIESYKRMLNPKLAADYAYMLFVVEGAEDYFHGKIADFAQTGFKALDEKTLQLTLHEPTPYFLNALIFYAWYPVPTKVIAKFDGMARRDSDWTKLGNIVGNGPFRLTAWKPNQILSVTRSETYWDHANVKLDGIDFYPVELTDTEERMFRAGQLDVTYDVPLSKIPTYQREHPDLIRIEPYCAVYFYRFNVQKKPLDDIRVRRALSLAIDRESLVKNVTQGGEKPAYSLVPPGVDGYEGDYQIHANLAEAKKLLAEAGYPDGKGFPHIEILYNTMEKHRVIAEAIQEMWRRNLGIDIGLYNEEWKVYLVSQKTMNFVIQRAGWVGDYADPHVFFDLWRSGGLNNNTGWANPEYDKMLDSALSSNSDQERFALYRKMEKIFLDDLPILPIYFYTHARLINAKVQGFHSTYLDDYPWKFADIAR